MVISPAEIPASLQFNAVEWFSQFSADGKPIDSTELQPILEFTLLWSLFERETCDRFVRLVDLRKHVDEASAKDQLMRDAYEPYLLFFRTRYSQFGEAGYLSSSLEPAQHSQGCGDSNEILLLQKVLEGTCKGLNDMVFALLFIAYRIRNNLFHGEKNIYRLHTQRSLFVAVNSLLATYLGQTCRRMRN
jgi:hypothetical protein